MIDLKKSLWIKAHLFYLGILSLLSIIIWPENEFFSFDKPESFSILMTGQIIILSYFVMRIGEKGGIYQIRQKINPLRRLKSEVTGTFLFFLVMFFSSFPLMIPFYFTGGIYGKDLLIGSLFIFISVITFINLSFCCSLLIKSIDFRSATTHILFFLFLGGLFLTRPGKEKFFHLNPLFFFFILSVSFISLFLGLKYGNLHESEVR